MKKYAIIVAGGSGSRMQSSQPKQFLELANRPILMHTLDAFFSYDHQMTIVLVLPEDHISTWQALVEQHNFLVPHEIVAGGATRFDSVRHGLDVIGDAGIVAIHDGARPLVSKEVISRTIEQAMKTGSGVAAVQVKDSIRQVKDGKNRSVDRNEFYAVQTPQTFNLAMIKNAFSAAMGNQFTDDASVAEAYGEEISLVEGSYANLKITTPEDLDLALAILDGIK